MIRHRNYYAMVAVRDQMDDNAGPGDVLLLYLPLAHNFGRLVHLSGPYAGFTLAFCVDPYKVGDALLAVRPTVFPSVPRIYEKVHGAVLARFDEATGVKRRLVDWALDVGGRVSVLREDAAAGSARPRDAAPPGGQARLLEGEGAARRTAADRAVRRRPARTRRAPLLPLARHPDPRGLWAHRVHDRRRLEPDDPLPIRHRRAGAAGLGAEARRRRRAVHSQPDRVRRLPQGRGGDARDPRRRRLAGHRGHRVDRR